MQERFLGYFQPDKDEKINDSIMDKLLAMGYLVEPDVEPFDPYAVYVDLELELDIDDD